MGYTRQGYKKHENILLEKVLIESEVLRKVKEIRCIMPKIGVRKLKYLLSEENLYIGRDHLFDLLSLNGLLVKRHYRKKYLSIPGNSRDKYDNLLENLEINKVNQVWVCDITYIRMSKGFNFLYLVTDYYSRKVVGHCLSDNLEAKNCITALKVALKGVKSSKGIIHHSDHGAQYVCKDYVNFLNKKGFVISLTGKNHCYDNSVAERVNNTLKHEFGLANVFTSTYILKEACSDGIRIYNEIRPHKSLDYVVPSNVYNSNIVGNLCPQGNYPQSTFV